MRAAATVTGFKQNGELAPAFAPKCNPAASRQGH
jgi:hypothetical protein